MIYFSGKKEKIKENLTLKIKKILEKNVKMLKERTNSKEVGFVTTGEERFKNVLDFKIKDKRGKISIQKIV